MQQYEQYKDSGVDWLGDIPAHWEVKRLSTCFKENCEINNSLCEVNALQFKFGEIIEKQKYDMDEAFTKTIEKYNIVKPNDIMINGLNLNYDFVTQRVGIVKNKGIITSAYLSLRPNNSISSNYYTYFFKSMDNKKVLNGIGVGIRLTLSFKEMKNIPIPLPPLAEQTAIANFLDTKCEQIDRAVAQKEKVVELLNERRQILIQRAVTRGLNPDVELRDSGIDWIGQIPAHWEVKPLKFISKLESGETISPEQFIESEGYPVYGGNGFRGYTTTFTNDGYFVLIGRQGALCGNVNYAKGKFYASEHAIVVYPLNKENTYWLGELIKVANLNRLSQSAAQPGIAVSIVKNILFPYPPLAEQTAIADYLDNVNEKIDRAIALKREEIEKLKEYKQTLINSAVTGKIKIA
ncbi:MAG: restriction endonuclease subunit S [Bacteroidales bacterium]